MEGRELVALSAALIAALLAIAKLIADKETRISDFRKDWINSFRAALSEMLGEAYAISGRIKIRIRHAELAKRHASSSKIQAPAASPLAATADEQEDAVQERPTADNSANAPFLAAVVEGEAQLVHPVLGAPELDPMLLTAEEVAELESSLTSHWNTLRKAHRTVLLHLNFSETAWATFPCEQSVTPAEKAEHTWDLLLRSSKLTKGLAVTSGYDPDQNGQPSEAAALLVAQLDELVRQLLGRYYEVGAEARYDMIRRSIDNSTLLGNLVLKPEWNRIKRGEDRYTLLLRVLGVVVLVGGLALAMFAFAPRKPVSGAPSEQVLSDVPINGPAAHVTCSPRPPPGKEWVRIPYVPGLHHQACQPKSLPQSAPQGSPSKYER
ncbi:hypothetical protein [Stenotrophomonas sp. PS02289]|uniref:hypothetical protein n=1 Tax=Stenotrophomonas sp. PS02289 TaxID=2991422 RepID=UPI00249AA4E7|nr:hypothetical protein [Stenotrophomonas sp. PS02289]